MIKKIWNWFIEIIKETLNLSWTLVGLVIATLTLTGSSQQITGLATVITLAVWLLTIGFRKEKKDKEKKERSR
tara:strand:- start:9 stop:227 length:219 start_codon:yes stop_codon:yes gene_type:complete